MSVMKFLPAPRFGVSSRYRSAAILLGALAAVFVFDERPARADLLNLERWATNQGGWVSPATWLSGDFDGNGKTDLAYLWVSPDIIIGERGPPFDFGAGSADVAIDLHLSCDNSAVPCPAGVPNANQAGAFFEQPGGGTSLVLTPSLDNCNGATGTCQWLSGDFDGDGKTDIAFVASIGGQISIWVGQSTGTGQFALCQWANHQGGWIGLSTWLAGDFDGDGKDDLAYVFSSAGGQIDIDVHKSLGTCSNGNGFSLSRWATNQGGWVSPGIFLASDFNGDGLLDIGLAWDDGGKIDLDAHLSNNPGFSLERWATGQGGWIVGSQWTSVRGRMNSRDRIPGTSMISGFFTSGPGDGLGTPGLGDIINVFNDGGAVSIDSHLADTNMFNFGQSSGVFELQRYATRQGTYPDNVVFLAGDFNGDTVGDVADPFAVNGRINIDVHRGTCGGPLDANGNCCAALSNVCNGVCCFGTCATGTGSTNNCCPAGQTCDSPPPPQPK